jgi:cellulose synthase/poly-beta-1,6-N-acetylglucosamine synthase-like glycosyltransferase
MPSLTALLHTFNDALTLGRALETLHPCDEILIVDHNSRDATRRVAREYGARIVEFRDSAHSLQSATSSWIFCLDPHESLTESLATSLYEWKSAANTANALNILLREETATGWIDLPAPQTRLVPKTWTHWQDCLPIGDPSHEILEGPVLKFLPDRNPAKSLAPPRL